MPLLIDCPSGHRLKVPRKRAGHHVRCPVCNQSTFVPPLAGAATLATGSSTSASEVIGSQSSQEIPESTGRQRSGVRPDSAEARVSTPAETGRPSRSACPRLASPRPKGSNQEEPDGREHYEPFPVISVGDHAVRPRAIANAGTRQHDERLWSILGLGLAMMAMAAFSAIPAVRELSAAGDKVTTDGWSHIVLLIALIQLSLAVYCDAIAGLERDLDLRTGDNRSRGVLRGRIGDVYAGDARQCTRAKTRPGGREISRHRRSMVFPGSLRRA